MAITVKTYGDTGGVQWHAWNTNASTTAATSIWGDWNNQWTTTSSATTIYRVQTWQSWTSTEPIRVYSMDDVSLRFSNGYAGEVARQEIRQDRTEDEWNDIRARNEARRLDRDADAVQAAARAQAHKLLAMILTPDQLESYEAHRHFDVVGSAGGVYRIHHGTSGNIRRVLDGAEVNRLCVHPQLWDNRGYLPTEDCLAAQALALMHDEIGAVSLANVHQGQRLLQAA